MSEQKNLTRQPEWFNETLITDSLDAREMLQSGQHPLAEVLARTAALKSRQIFKLITPFTPMPLIEKVTEKGCEVFVLTINNAETHTFFFKV